MGNIHFYFQTFFQKKTFFILMLPPPTAVHTQAVWDPALNVAALHVLEMPVLNLHVADRRCWAMGSPVLHATWAAVEQ